MKILIVDDSKTMRYVLITQLKELGYDTLIEADCVDKAKLLCSANPPPALVISDWNMPNASGLDLLKFLKSNPSTKDIPFIMLTTERDRAKIVEATRAGLQSYLLKPIRKVILIEKMRELAAAYGFMYPKEGNVVQAGSVVLLPEENHPLKGKIKKEQIEKVIEAFSQVWKNESTVLGFEAFITKEIFGGSLDELDEVTFFIQTILVAAQDAIEHKLNQLVE